MNKSKILNLIFYTAIVVTSFLLYSSRFYPVLNSDDALNILMTYYYDLPNDFYCWGQDRGGTIIPFISQFFHKILGFSPVLSVSFSNYLILLAGYIGFSSLFKNKSTKLIFALIWFFPPIRFIDLTRFPIGIQYSLVGIAIYLINRIDFINKKPKRNHLLLLSTVVLLSISIWVSDLTAVTIAILVFVLSIYHFLFEKKKGINKYVLIYSAAGILATTLFIKYAKSYATVITKNYASFNNWENIKDGISILIRNISEVMTFKTDEFYFGIYAWLMVVFCLFLIGSYYKQNFIKLLKTNKWVTFFILDFFAIFGVILLSKWVFLNGMGRWYFVTSYISLSLFILLLFDNLQMTDIRNKIVTVLLFISVLIGGFSTIHFMKYVNPKRLSSEVKLRSEFLTLGEVGLIGNFWNSYISAVPDPSKIKATPHDKDDVRSQKMVDEVFGQPNLYVIRDSWMKEFPDTLYQFGYVLKKSGNPLVLGGCDLNKYVVIKQNQTFNLSEFPHKTSVQKTEEKIFIPKDSMDLINDYAVWGPFTQLLVGNYSLQINLTVENATPGEPIGFIDVSYNFGENVLTEKELVPTDSLSSSIPFEIEFSTKERLSGVEFRVFSKGGADITIKEVKLIEK